MILLSSCVPLDFRKAAGTDCGVRVALTAGSTICGLFAIFQMLAMEGKLKAATCAGTLVLPISHCDSDTGECADNQTIDCTLEFEQRVVHGFDGKDESTCPDGCEFNDNALTPEEAMAMFVATGGGCLALYSFWMLVRCCVFSKHKREARREELRQAMEKKRAASGKLSRKNVYSM